MSKEALEALHSNLEQLERAFGRPIQDTDRLFPTGAAEPEHELTREVVRGMLEGNLPSRFIYAYLKTGLLITTSNRKLTPISSLRAWEAAVREWERREDDGADILDVLSEFGPRALRGAAELRPHVYAFRLVLTSVLTKRAEVRAPPHRFSGVEGIDEYGIFCATRAVKTLMAIEQICDVGFQEDALALVRGIFECYLHLAYTAEVAHGMDCLVRARIGLRAGTHSFRTKSNGKFDKHWIVDNTTGQQYRNDIQPYTMANALGTSTASIFGAYYSRLSHDVHPHAIAVERYLVDSCLVANQEWDPYGATWLALAFMCLVSDKLASFRSMTDLDKRDLTYAGWRCAFLLRSITNHIAPELRCAALEARLHEISMKYDASSDRWLGR